MASTHQFEVSSQLLNNLIVLTNQTAAKSLDETNNDNEFFQENMNLFVKSYMVLMCAYLESYLKVLTKNYIDSIEKSLQTSSYPKNLLRWSVLKEKYKHTTDGIEDTFSLGISNDDIDKNLSANPHKTAPFFHRLGINLEALDEYNALKEQVEMIVNKRNSIVHYNDEASDIAPHDIIDNASLILRYMKVLDEQVILCMSNFRTDVAV